MAQKNIRISPSLLRIFRNCPRCFWFHVNTKHKLNKYIFPSLASGMDNVIKGYFDKHRGKETLPDELLGRIDGLLVGDQKLINKWRNWKSGLSYIDEELGMSVIGALDDCVLFDDKFAPLDYKTKGYEGREPYSLHYQDQLDLYGFLLSKNGFKVLSVGYLVYYYPKDVVESGIFQFGIDVQKVDISPDRIFKVIKKAAEAGMSDEPPIKYKSCALCSWQEEEYIGAIINI